MTISDFLQKYKIVMHPNFWPVFVFFFYIAPILHLSPCPWGTLCTSLDNSCAVISAILACKIREATYLCLTELKRCSTLPIAEEKLSRRREREREVCARAEQSRRTERERRERERRGCYAAHAEQSKTHRDRDRERDRERERCVARALNRADAQREREISEST